MIKPMRGQVVIRETYRTSDRLWTPRPGARDVKTHTGVVLAVGPPARAGKDGSGGEVPHGFVVGDTVEFFFTHNEEAHTYEWEGEKAVWIPQQNISAVWDG